MPEVSEKALSLWAKVYTFQRQIVGAETRFAVLLGWVNAILLRPFPLCVGSKRVQEHIFGKRNLPALYAFPFRCPQAGCMSMVPTHTVRDLFLYSFCHATRQESLSVTKARGISYLAGWKPPIWSAQPGCCDPSTRGSLPPP